MKTIHIEVNDFLAAIIRIAAGVLLVIFPQESLNVITYGIGIISLVYGVLRIISYFRNKSLSVFCRGAVFRDCAGSHRTVFFSQSGRYLCGAADCTGYPGAGGGHLQAAKRADAQNYGYQRWVAATVVSVCIIALGILLIFNPFNALVITMRVLGIVLAADGIAGLWVNFIIKRYYQ